MGRYYLLIVTALAEGGTGVGLVAAPAAVIALLFGATEPAAETLAVSRVTGGALAALAIACWAVRNDPGRPAQRDVLAAVLLYDVTAAAALFAAGVDAGHGGIALWPAVAAHAGLAGWSVLCLMGGPNARGRVGCGTSESD